MERIWLPNLASSVLVTTSKAPVPSSVALVTTSDALVSTSVLVTGLGRDFGAFPVYIRVICAY